LLLETHKYAFEFIAIMELTILGTSSMVPTKERNVTAFFIRYKTEGILVDCGEGTQRQMNIAGINRNKITKILITHWHGDHVSGLMGLFHTLGNIDGKHKISLYGPRGTKNYIKHLLQACFFDVRIDLTVTEIEPHGVEKFFENKDFYLECTKMKHGTDCLAYSFVEKDKRKIIKSFLKRNNVPDGPHLKMLQAGKSIVYNGVKIDVEKATTVVKGRKVTFILDTLLNDNCFKIAKDANLLVCEACYTSQLAHKGEAYQHLTAKEAALIASRAGVKELILTHFSQRYKSAYEIEEDAKIYFDNVRVGEDLMRVKF